ncbi:MAG: hypothetical protein K0R17_2434 [Rariglobus sp.]|jgi:hypothetical protein|nr:hypothetical protein [Rariglobus sp.]
MSDRNVGRIKMDIPLKTIDVWEVEGAPAPRDFLSAVTKLLKTGDIIVFAAYEPTESLREALLRLGGIKRQELPQFYTSFEANRSEHPDGCAFEFSITESCIDRILELPDDVLHQKDIPSFYDHFIAYRRGHPLVPLVTFHDAACGGTLYLSGLYTEEEAGAFSVLLGLKSKSILNPVLDFMKNENGTKPCASNDPQPPVST